MDLNVEIVGLNRRPDESLAEFKERAMKIPFVRKSLDHAMVEFSPKYCSTFTPKLLTSADTYYFSLTSGETCNFAHKRSENFSEPARSSKAGVGFDLDVIDNITLSDDILKHPRNGYLPPTAWD